MILVTYLYIIDLHVCMYIQAMKVSSSSPLQLVTLVQSNRFTIVSGPSCSGKTSVIQVAADTLSQVPTSGPVSVTTLVTGAMREEQLLGYQDKKKG